MASILDQLDRLGAEHPHKLLYSYLDLNGNPIECYTYASFIERTKAIAGHLLKERPFRTAGPAAARLPAGPGDDLRVLWLRARRIDPRAGLSSEFSRLPERPVQNGPHRQGLPGVRDFDQRGLSRISEDKSHAKRGRGIRCRCRLHLRSALDCHGRVRRNDFATSRFSTPRRFCFSSTRRARPWSPRASW